MKYEIGVRRVEIEFLGKIDKYLNLELYVDGEFADTAVFDKDDLLWLLDQKE